jgi:hypothetical protein
MAGNPSAIHCKPVLRCSTERLYANRIVRSTKLCSAQRKFGTTLASYVGESARNTFKSNRKQPFSLDSI